MTAYTDFHYSPTGSGVISGAQVLEQTEQGINGLGQYVQDNVSGAIDTANQALTIAQTADTNATLALNTANSFASAISAANNTANNALTTAQSAQNTANTASSLAITANNNANTALNAANTATSNVATLTGTVNSLGNRMTTAENAISTNAGNITTLQTNLQTTNNNVTAAANAASSAQATATSAQSTATLARNQAYVLRYTGTTITGGGTIAYADIDNTDNIKAGDKIIDATGAIYEIASVDIANETITVSASEIINLAVLPDLFNSANVWSGDQNFRKTLLIKNSVAVSAGSYDIGINFFDSVGNRYGYIQPYITSNNQKRLMFGSDTGELSCNSDLIPANNNLNFGNSTLKWKTLNGTNPGALSLPSSNYIEIDTTNWDLTGADNSYTPPEDGYIFCGSSFGTDIKIFDFTTTLGSTSHSSTVKPNYVCLPVRKNDNCIVGFIGSAPPIARFFPMQGNV